MPHTKTTHDLKLFDVSNVLLTFILIFIIKCNGKKYLTFALNNNIKKVPSFFTGSATNNSKVDLMLQIYMKLPQSLTASSSNR